MRSPLKLPTRLLAAETAPKVGLAPLFHVTAPALALPPLAQ